MPAGGAYGIHIDGEGIHRQLMIYSDDSGETGTLPRDITATMPQHNIPCYFGSSEGRQPTVGPHPGHEDKYQADDK